MTKNRATRLIVPLLAAAMIFISACGSSGGSDGASNSTKPAAGAQSGESTTAPDGGSAGGKVQSGDVAVTIKGFAFNPKDLKIKVGSKVTWTNEDTASHTATSDDDGVFDTKTLKKGASGSHTFDKAGTFSYHCNIHPTMTAEIDVQ